MNDNKKKQKVEDQYLMEELAINKDELKALKKKLSKVDPRPERGAETFFRLVSKNQYTLNSMIDRKSSILISINSIILSVVLGTVLSRLKTDAHLIYPATMILFTNLLSITYAIFSTRPELKHGGSANKNTMFYGNFSEMTEREYIDEVTGLLTKGDLLYEKIAQDTYHLGKVMNKKFKSLRISFNIFLIGIILSVIAFIACHILADLL